MVSRRWFAVVLARDACWKRFKRVADRLGVARAVASAAAPAVASAVASAVGGRNQHRGWFIVRGGLRRRAYRDKRANVVLFEGQARKLCRALGSGGISQNVPVVFWGPARAREVAR